MLCRCLQNALALLQILNRWLCFWPWQQSSHGGQAILCGKLLQWWQLNIIGTVHKLGQLIRWHAEKFGKRTDSKLPCRLIERLHVT